MGGERQRRTAGREVDESHVPSEVALGDRLPVVAEPGHDLTGRGTHEALHLRRPLQHREQAAATLDRVVAAVRLDREEQREVGSTRGTVRRLGPPAPQQGDVCLAPGTIGVALGPAHVGDGETSCDQRHHKGERRRATPPPRQTPGAAVLADVLAFELVLGHSVNGCGEIGHRLPGTAIDGGRVAARRTPAQVQMARLVVEAANQCRRQRR